MKQYDVGAEIAARLLGLLFTLVIALLGAWIGVSLWGAIMVEIFGLPALTFWQFYGLIILLRILLPVKIIERKKED